jgi:hypothetical protein
MSSPFEPNNWPWLVPQERRRSPSGWTEIYELSNSLWDFYGVLCRAFYAAKNDIKDPDLGFLTEQYFVGREFEDNVGEMNYLFQDRLKDVYRVDDLPAGYIGLASEDRPDMEAIVNDATITYKPDAPGLEILRKFLFLVQPTLEKKTLSYWSVSNIRTRSSVPKTTTGMHNWHKDGLPNIFLKILCYVLPPNEENGTVDIQTIDGRVVRLESDKPSWLLFAPNILEHRGVAGRTSPRPLVEIILAPALGADMEPKFVGQGANRFWYPSIPACVPGNTDVPLEIGNFKLENTQKQFSALIDKYLRSERNYREAQNTIAALSKELQAVSANGRVKRYFDRARASLRV